jgi:hypothetical protein
MSLDEDVRKDITVAVESYVIKSDNIFSFDPNLVKIDLYNFKITKCLYKLRVNVVEALKNEKYKVLEYNSDIESPVVNMSKVEMSFKEVVKELKTSEDPEFIIAAHEKYPFLKDAIDKLGFERIERLKYVVTNVKKELIKHLDISKASKIAKILAESGRFKSGAFIASREARDMLIKLYKEFDISKGPNLKDYYELKDITKRVKGKVVTGYIVIIPRVLLK